MKDLNAPPPALPPKDPTVQGRESAFLGSESAQGFKHTDTGPWTLGIPWPVLEQFRSRLAGIAMPHEYVLPFAVFLGGLTVAAAMPSHARAQTLETARDGLTRAARETLRDAIEFALQEEAQTLVRSSSSIPGDTAYQCLFMGVAYAQSNHLPQTHAWLELGCFQDNLTCLLFAMGFLSMDDPQARRLTRKIRAHIDALTEENFGPEILRLLVVLRSEI